MDFTLERDPIASQPISVVIPADRFGTELTTLLDDAHKTLKALMRPFEILVVSPAGAELTGGSPEVKRLTSEQPGEGAAVKQGIAAATHPLLFLLPANAGVSPRVLGKFLEAIDQADIVAGVRQGLSRWSRFRQGGSGWWLFGVALSDIACPVRLYRRSIFERLELQSKGFFIHHEIAAKANFIGCLLTEVEVEGAAERGGPAEPSAWKDLRNVFNRPRFAAWKPEASPPESASAVAADGAKAEKKREISEALPHHPDVHRQ